MNLFTHTLHPGIGSSIKKFSDFTGAVDQTDEVVATKTTCNKDIGQRNSMLQR